MIYDTLKYVSKIDHKPQLLLCLGHFPSFKHKNTLFIKFVITNFRKHSTRLIFALVDNTIYNWYMKNNSGFGGVREVQILHTNLYATE